MNKLRKSWMFGYWRERIKRKTCQRKENKDQVEYVPYRLVKVFDAILTSRQRREKLQ